MGLFDIFKRKKDNSALDAYLSEMRQKMFPGGNEEIQRQVNEVCRLLNNRYDKSVVSSGLLYMSSLMFTSQDKSADRIVKRGALLRPGNILTEQDAMTIYKYVVRKQLEKIMPQYDERMFNEFYKSIGNMEGGSTTDVIPGAYGEYGLCETNPIPVRGIPNNETYLRKLSLISGEEITWRRLGSTSAPNISGPIDIYEITTKNGVEICDIYISPYQNTISNKAPRGFIIK